MSIYVDIHAVQSVGPNNLNRDLNGSPKTAMYGGVRRARVSSQSWKRPMRLDFREKYSPENLGIRTKRIVELLAKRIAALDPELEATAVEIAAETFNVAGIKVSKPKKNEDQQDPSLYQPGYLVFISEAQVENVAGIAVEAINEGGIADLKKRKSDLKRALKADLSVDLALFGRMVADDADLNVDASCQVAHAISTHAVGTEFDFFTAVDDEKAMSDAADAGAGMMGTVEFSSATLYRYATLNATALAEQLGSQEAAAKAIGGFVDVFATSLPTGKQNTFAAHTLPAALIVSIRSDRPISLVGAFENPVYPRVHPEAPATGYTEASVRRMVEHAADLEASYGPGNTQVLAFGTGAGKSALERDHALGVHCNTMHDLVNAVTEEVQKRLDVQ